MNESEMETLAREAGVTANVQFVRDQPKGTEWVVTLRRRASAQRVVAVVVMGADWAGERPTAADTLNLLGLQAHKVQDVSFEDWCAASSRQPGQEGSYTAYRFQQDQARRLSRMLGIPLYAKLMEMYHDGK